VNTLFLIITLLCYIIYSTFDPSIPSEGEFMKYITYVMLFLITSINIIKNKAFFLKYYRWFILLFFLLLYLHFKMTEDDLLITFIPFFIFLNLTSASVSKYNVKLLSLFFFVFYVLLILFDYKEMLRCIFSSDYEDGWEIIFYNSNVASIFICSVFCATYLFMQNKLLTKISFILIVVGLLACKSRNALLFFVIVNSFLFFKPWLINKQKYLPLLIMLFLLCALYYMIIVEPYLVNLSSVSLFGKSEGSTGRALQILFVIQNFDISLWGSGRSLINEAVTDEVSYVIHNLYINTLYAMGLLYFLFYLYFISKFYIYLKNYESRVFLLSFHVYFFFETGVALGFALNYFLPMMIVAYSALNQVEFKLDKKYENHNRIF